MQHYRFSHWERDESQSICEGQSPTLEDTGVRFKIGAMSTTMEAANLDQLFAAVKVAHNAQLKMGAKRIYMVLNVDDRKDTDASIETKLHSVDIEA